MTLQDYTIEELKAELKRRDELAKVEREKIKRCRMCTHYGEVTYYGKSLSKEDHKLSRCCQFFSWGKNNKYRRCHAPSQIACEYFEPIIND